MTFRIRTQGPVTKSGSCTKGTSPPETRSYTSLYNTCEDSVTDKPYTDHSLLMKKMTWQKNLFSGSTGTPGTAGYRLASATPVEGGSEPSHLSISGVPSNGTVAAQTLARTNPSQAHVQLPVFFAELREIPRLVRDIGSAFLKSGGRKLSGAGAASNATLGWNFGIAPLISDLSKLLDFESACNKRFRELEALRDNGGLSRTFQAFTGSENFSENLIVESFMGTIRVQRTTNTIKRKWGAVRWVPNPGSLPEDNEQLRKLARDLALGLHRSQQLNNVWDALPWSWLIDWFSNVGDVIQGSNNSVALPAGPVNVCTHTISTLQLKPTLKPSWASVTDGAGRVEWKERTLASPSLIDASWPILTNRQLSILGALTVLKIGR